MYIDTVLCSGKSGLPCDLSGNIVGIGMLDIDT